jgi:hypothetical protein
VAAILMYAGFLMASAPATEAEKGEALEAAAQAV